MVLDWEVRLLHRDDVTEAARISASAFCREAFAQRMLDFSEKRNPDRLLHAFQRAVEVRIEAFLSAGHPIQGLFVFGQLAAVAVYRSSSGRRTVVAGLMHGLCRLRQLVPLLAYVRWRHLIDMTSLTAVPTDLPVNYLMLETLAVQPESQGEGWGSKLLKEGQQLAKVMGTSGVYLYTGDSKTRAWYEKHGFDVLAVRTVGDFSAYHMFWSYPEREEIR